MGKERPDHHDAELVIRVYELRGEPVMRQSRDAINGTFVAREGREGRALFEGVAARIKKRAEARAAQS
jgi:hypothetical protein